MQFAKRLQTFSTNVFADMDRAKAAAQKAGQEIIDLSLGSSDLPASDLVIKTIESSLQDSKTHRYLLYHGTGAFRQAAANWYLDKFGIDVDPETEVLQLIGSQEGTAHLPLALLNPGDYALLQDPGYPSHYGGVYLASGQVYTMPLFAKNQFLPVLEDIPESILSKARLMVLSYPHNPTTAIAPLSFFQKAVSFCRRHDLVLVHDFPYNDIVFPPTPPAPSIFQADKKKEISIEFFSLSKSYNMGGFRVAFAIGNRELISALRQVKAAIDFNQYLGILNGAITALTTDETTVAKTVATYEQRRDIFIAALANFGWQVPTPPATMYVWAQLPYPWQNNSVKFCQELVAQTGVAVNPGAGFGQAGEGYVRFALVRSEAVLEKAASKIAAFLD